MHVLNAAALAEGAGAVESSRGKVMRPEVFVDVLREKKRFLEECSLKKRDKLLIEADIFTILGVSFCVMQNAFNFNEKKRSCTVTEVFYSTKLSFFKLIELLVLFAPHKFFLIATVTLSFLMVSEYKYFLHKLARVSRSSIWKKSGAPISQI